MNDTTTLSPADQILALMHFMPRSQWACLMMGLQGEERSHFAQLLKTYAERVATMPETYEQDGKGDEAIVYLHYFRGGADWYITERDSDPDQSGQHQAFGLACPFGDEGELGYISIVELRQIGAELDLYFEPCTMAEIRKNRALN